jgi:hypothetical protein
MTAQKTYLLFCADTTVKSAKAVTRALEEVRNILKEQKEEEWSEKNIKQEPCTEGILKILAEAVKWNCSQKRRDKKAARFIKACEGFKMRQCCTAIVVTTILTYSIPR